MAGAQQKSIFEVYSTTKVLRPAELLNLGVTPVQLTPTPGPGQVLVPGQIALVYNFNRFDFSASPSVNVEIGATGTGVLHSSISGLTGSGASTLIIPQLSFDAGAVDFTAPYLGQPLMLVLVGGAFAAGGIETATIGAAGTGYAPGDTGTITTGDGNAHYQVLTVGGLGDVTSFLITAPGTGYAAGAGQATATGAPQAGIGINFTVNITKINDGDGTIKVTTLYQVIDVP